MKNNARHQEALSALRLQYAESLAAEVAPLNFARDCLIANVHDEAAHKELARQAHRLAGSAGSFGFHEVSRIAGDIERRLEQGEIRQNGLAVLIDGIDRLKAALGDAQSTGLAKPPEIWGQTPQDASPAREPAALQPPAGLAPSPPLPGPNPFPAMGPAIGDTAKRNTSDDAAKTEAAPARKRRLLVIEDDPTMAHLLESLMGAEVETEVLAEGGAAPATARRFKPDLILLDYDLPDGSGLDIISRLQSEEALRSIPIMMMTSNNDPDTVIAAFNAGARDYFTKPFEPVSFVNHIRNVLARTDYTIMIVDDDPAICQLMDYRFEALGVRCTAAANGLEALDMIRESPPDLIILDRMMPGLDGAGVLFELKSDPVLQEIPVIILTVRNNAGDGYKWLQRGAIDFIPKPFDPEELILRASRALKIEHVA